MIVFELIWEIKKRQTSKDAAFDLSRMMIPRDFLEYFEIFGIKNYTVNGLFCMRKKA